MQVTKSSSIHFNLYHTFLKFLTTAFHIYIHLYLAGLPKLKIEECAARQQARIDGGAQVIVGVNKYIPKEAEQALEVRVIDNSSVKEKQLARLRSVKAARDGAAVAHALQALEDAAQGEDRGANLMELCVNAARLRATVGEISDAMERAWGRYEGGSEFYLYVLVFVLKSAAEKQGGAEFTNCIGFFCISSLFLTTGGMATGTYGAELKASVEAEVQEVDVAVKKFEAQAGRRPRILIAKMGMDGHDRGAKVMATG